MDRRDLLKTLALSGGYLIATPTLIQMLSSCEAKQSRNWKPLFLSDVQAYVIEHLSNIILPKSDTLGAIDINTPQFLDLILQDVIAKEEQDTFIKGSNIFHLKFKSLFKKDVLRGTEDEFSEILSMYFNISEQKEEQVFKLVNSDSASTIMNDTYFLYKYLLFVKQYTLLAYYTSKEIKGDILEFDSFTGSYIPCI